MTKASTSSDPDAGFGQDHPNCNDKVHTPSLNTFNNPVFYTPQASDLNGSDIKVTSTHKATEEQMMARSTVNSHEGLMIALKQETDDILRTPMTPGPPGRVSEDGLPLGVKEATIEYDQGLYSTKTVFQDCLPPQLVCSNAISPPDMDKDLHSLLIPHPASSEDVFSDPHQAEPADKSDLLPVVRHRNLSKEQVFRRINQAPLSAIFEESDPPAGAQHQCPCNVCQDMPDSSGIVWFHLCPRFTTMAQENGFQYEPYEGRLIVHHGHDTSSISLITEGPFEARFVPAVALPPVVETSTPKRAKAPKPPRLEFRSMHSASRIAKPSQETRSPSNPALVLTPALQRPISPTRVFGASSLNQLPTIYGPKTVSSRPVLTATEDKEVDESPCPGVIDSQENVHPALRIGDVQPAKWTTLPTRTQSQSALRDGLAQLPRSGRSKKARPSVSFSDFSGRPARIDSLGAPTHPGPAESNNRNRTHRHLKMESSSQNQSARHIAEFAASTSTVSPSAGPEHTPSEYLCPSTASCVSWNRNSSLSTNGMPLQHVHAGKVQAGTAAMQEAESAAQFQPSKAVIETTDPVQNPSPFSPQSFHTAPGSRSGPSPMIPAPLIARTASSSALEKLRSNNPAQNSPFFQDRAYHRPQASEQSIAQSLQSINSLRFQRNSERVSGTTLLNGTAFDSAEESTYEDAEEAERNSPDYDRRNSFHVPYQGSNISSTDPALTAGAAEARRAKILDSSMDFHNANSKHGIPANNALETVGATEAHCYLNARYTSRRASVPMGQGIADPMTSPLSLTPSGINISSGHASSSSSSSSSASSSANELTSYLSSFNPAHRTQLPPARALLIRQNRDLHMYKLQDWLGMDASTTTTTTSASSAVSPPAPANQQGKLHRMGILDTLAADGQLVRKEEPRYKVLAKKGSRILRGGGGKLVERVKKPWRVGPGDWVDDDDDDDDGRY